MNESTIRKPLRVWPGVVAAVLLVIFRFVLPMIEPRAFLVGMFAALFCALAIVVWWLFFSRARWAERLGAVALIVLAVFALLRLVDVSLRTGMMGLLPVAYSLFVFPVALAIWAAATSRFSDPVRRILLVLTVALVVGGFTMLRTDGILGGRSQFAWRWSQTSEERLLAKGGDDLIPVVPRPGSTAPVAPPASSAPSVASLPAASSATPLASPSAPVAPPEWPGFRGPERDGVVRNARIETDWTKFPPVEVWRRPVGPGWSSFSVQGDLLYTQEQRGDEELASCYRLSSGQPVWRHGDKVRFWESNGGAGPRGTPTISGGRIYTFGATGILNALDARSGALVWTRDVTADLETEVPMWGFSSSPLVERDLVIVAAAGILAAYDVTSGARRWIGPRRSFSYSSPHAATIDGVRQVLLLAPPGVVSVSSADGALLWEHKWEGGGIVQPALVGERDVIINAIEGMGGIGLRRLAIAHAPGGWTAEERWTSNGLKPYFSDFVMHQGYAFGFDGSILSCIDLADGKRKWKGGRYGEGQLVLLADRDVLLVISEEGELALVKATPDQFTELARVRAIEGKTWNHPVVVGDILLVRNGQEMAAFRLAPAGR
jgi:hypothetical protein